MDNNKNPDSFKEYFEQKSVQAFEEAQRGERITQEMKELEKGRQKVEEVRLEQEFEEYIQKLEDRLAQYTSQKQVDDFRQNCENSGITIVEYADKLEDLIELEKNSRELI